uniref:BED-type domain-containing protein n=2 Tax=Amphimedon queenslandica TaxID=400682 RepID=A0A1X7VHD4_AMPQE
MASPSSTSKRSRSSVWTYFNKVHDDKNAACLICKSKLTYCKNTSNLLKHLQTKHQKEYQECLEERKANENQKKAKGSESSTPVQTIPAMFLQSHPYSSDSMKRKKIDDAVIEFLCKDMQPTSVVEDAGFKKLVTVLDNRYQIPSRRTITREILPKKYESTKAKIEEMNAATSVAHTTDIWTSCQTKSYCCVTTHLINGDWELKSYLLETFHFCLDHTAANISMELQRVVESWNIQDKIVCVVTDNAANMVAAISSTRWRHLPCFAHSLNVVVQNSIKSDPELFAVQTKCKNVVSHFHRSVKSTEKLGEIQLQLSLPEHKLVQDVSTRWISTYIMLERFYEQFEAITTTLCLVNQNDLCLKADGKDNSRALQLLKQFLEATENISGQAYVSISMIVPLTKILQQHCSSLYRANPSSVLTGSLNSELNNRFTSIETHYVTAVSTLLDPRLKKIPSLTRQPLATQ